MKKLQRIGTILIFGTLLVLFPTVTAIGNAFSLTAVTGKTETTPTAMTASWYDTSWQFRRPLTIDNTTNATALTNYQEKITLPATFNFSQAQSSGNDFRFTDSNGATLLKYWTESYNPATQTGVFWVKIPVIAAAKQFICITATQALRQPAMVRPPSLFSTILPTLSGRLFRPCPSPPPTKP